LRRYIKELLVYLRKNGKKSGGGAVKEKGGGKKGKAKGKAKQESSDEAGRCRLTLSIAR
jgi:hypothetical protein